MSRTSLHVLGLVFIAGVVFFTNLGGPRLWDRDEPRNAGCAAEMVARGNLVTPWFNDQVRDHKPVLLYWLMMSAYAVMGVNEFSARFWSAALGIGTVLLTYVIGRRLFNPRAAFWGGAALATSMMFCVASRAATPDAPLIFFGTAALAIYVLGTFRPKETPDAPPTLRVAGRYYPGSTLVVAAMFAMMGLAALDKGPIGVILPTAVMGMFLLIVRLPKTDKEHSLQQPTQSQWKIAGVALLTVLAVLAVEFIPLDGIKGAILIRIALMGLAIAAGYALIGRLDILRPFGPLHFLKTCWSMRLLTGLVAISIVALPWYAYVTMISPEWTEGFFLTHNLARGTQAMEGHGGSMLYYPTAVLLGFFPWSLFFGPMIIEIVARTRRDDAHKYAYIFLACWVCVYVGVLSIAATKLPSYVTPMYPALALLAGAFIDRLLAHETAVSRNWMRACLGGLSVAGVAFVVGVTIAASQFLPGDMWIGLVGLIPLAAGAVALWLYEKENYQGAMRVFATSAVMLSVILFGFVAWRVDRYQRADILVNAIKERSDNPTVRSFGAHEPSWVFYLGHPVRRLAHKPTKLVDFFQESGGSTDAFVITTVSHFEKNRDALPEGVRVLAQAPYFLKNADLVVLGRGESDEPIRTARASSGPEAKTR